jgi:hypothetical protein
VPRVASWFALQQLCPWHVGSRNFGCSALRSCCCLPLAGPWEANTRYKITITLQNPAAPVQPPAVPPKPPSLWMAPLQYIVQYNSSGHAVGRSVRVRGDKQGQICSLR